MKNSNRLSLELGLGKLIKTPNGNAKELKENKQFSERRPNLQHYTTWSQ
jgi:hypothetical protein